MAEDIRDMFITGTVAEFKRQTGADLYLRRGGLELLDSNRLFAVGGYDKVFSLEFNEPVLGVKIINAKNVDRERVNTDKNMCYCISKGDLQWNHYEDGKIFFPGPVRFASVLDLEFLNEVNLHWKGRNTGFIPGSFVFGHFEIFRNGVDTDEAVEGVPEGTVLVRRTLGDGKKNTFNPQNGKAV